MITEDDMSGTSQAAMSLLNRDPEVDGESRKKKVVKDVIDNAIKKRKGKDKFDPDPELRDQDTIVKT